MRVVVEMVGNAFRTVRRILIGLVVLVWVLWTATTVSLGVVSTVISSAFEAVTGIPTVSTQLSTKKAEAAALRGELAAAKKVASVAEGTAVGRGLALAQEKAASKALRAEAKAKALLASKWEGRSIGLALSLEREKLAGTSDAAALKLVGQVKKRTARVAAVSLGSTIGQSIPWIGAGVVVAATIYEIDVACETMRDMNALEQALDPSALVDPEVERVCGMKVPSKDEVSATVKASPGAAWNAAENGLQGVLNVLSSTPKVD